MIVIKTALLFLFLFQAAAPYVPNPGGEDAGENMVCAGPDVFDSFSGLIALEDWVDYGTYCSTPSLPPRPPGMDQIQAEMYCVMNADQYFAGSYTTCMAQFGYMDAY